jgi:hypothetical protein
MSSVIIAKTYSTYISGGIEFKVIKAQGTHESISIAVDWANGEPMEHLSELTLNDSDMMKLAELFEHVSQEVNA